MSKKTIELLLHSESDTKILAHALALAGVIGSVWLEGGLGVGKTTLCRYWLQALGHEGSVKSPTYTLVEPYEIDLKASISENSSLNSPLSVYHADLYRLQDPEELEFIGFDEYLADPKSLVIIEWASRAKDFLPCPDITINIQNYNVKNNDNVRQVAIKASAAVITQLTVSTQSLSTLKV